MKNIAVVLSGCGAKDGTEITEAVSTLLTLSELKVGYEIFAPNLDFPSTHHLTLEDQNPRNALAEAARIARGKIKDLQLLEVKSFDGLVFPGGYGVARNLCDWVKKGAQCQVLPQVRHIIEEFFAQSKPICAICIAPVLLARVLGSHSPSLTLGKGAEAAQEIEKTGAQHVPCAVDDYVSDREAKLISTPAYMLEASPFEVYTGIRKALHELVEMA